jgi:hypothetical protein
MTITDVIHPEAPMPDSEITIQVKMAFEAETERDSKLAFGILAPKSWNLGQTAKLTLTTTADIEKNVVTDHPLTLIPANETNPSTGTPWPASFQSRFGLQGNYGPVEWVVFESSHVFTADATNSHAYAKINGTMTIKLPTGPENIRVNMAYTYCGKGYGFGGEEYPDKDVIAMKMLEVGDMSGEVADYTIAQAVSTTPSVFGWGDIFAINFREQSSALKGTDAVYLQAKVVYDGGKEKTIYEISDKTLMESQGGDLWQRYIYPLDFFDLPAGTAIERVEVYMTDKTGSVEVKDPADANFIIIEDTEDDK